MKRIAYAVLSALTFGLLLMLVGMHAMLMPRSRT